MGWHMIESRLVFIQSTLHTDELLSCSFPETPETPKESLNIHACDSSMGGSKLEGLSNVYTTHMYTQ